MVFDDVDDSTVFCDFVDVAVWIVVNVVDLLVVVVLVNLIVTYGGGTGQSFPHLYSQKYPCTSVIFSEQS